MTSLRTIALLLCVSALQPERRRAGLAFTAEPLDIDVGSVTREQFDALRADPKLSVSFALVKNDERQLVGADMSDELLAELLGQAGVAFRDPDALIEPTTGIPSESGASAPIEAAQAAGAVGVSADGAATAVAKVEEKTGADANPKPVAAKAAGRKAKG